ncbi:MAG: O-antigen ligase family protein [Gammaproteobacteria bacterium]|jgi:hypothetical protein|nr:O-antigen ligase family protein [Gammaproteobacteria bacterium]
MNQVRFFFIFLEFFVLFLLFNPLLFSFYSFSNNSYELQRVLEWILIGLSLLHLGIDQPVRQHAFAFLQGLCTYQKILLALIFILGLISSLHAVYPAYALLEYTTFCGLFFTTLLFTGLFCLKKEGYLQCFYAFILITFGVSCVTALLMLYDMLNLPGFDKGGDMMYTILASPGYMNRRFYDDVACMVLPILIGLAYRKDGKKIQINWVVFMILAYMYTRGIISHSRIYLFEPLALFVLFPIFYKRKALPFLGIQFAAIIVGAALYALFYMHHGLTPGEFPGRTFLNHRYLLWSISIHLMIHHPLLGVGPLHFNLYAFPFEISAAHPHSAVMVIGAEWGLVVLLSLGALVITGLFGCVKNNHLVSMPLMGSLLGALMMAQVDGLILMPAGQMMLCLILAWAFSSQSAGGTSITQLAMSRWWVPVLFSLSICAFGVMLWVGIPLLLNMNEILFGFLNHCNQDCLLSPDYWSEGFIQFYSPSV